MQHRELTLIKKNYKEWMFSIMEKWLNREMMVHEHFCKWNEFPITTWLFMWENLAGLQEAEVLLLS